MHSWSIIVIMSRHGKQISRRVFLYIELELWVCSWQIICTWGNGCTKLWHRRWKNIEFTGKWRNSVAFIMFHISAQRWHQGHEQTHGENGLLMFDLLCKWFLHGCFCTYSNMSLVQDIFCVAVLLTLLTSGIVAAFGLAALLHRWFIFIKSVLCQTPTWPDIFILKHLFLL